MSNYFFSRKGDAKEQSFSLRETLHHYFNQVCKRSIEWQ